jgi:hypothetical protein
MFARLPSTCWQFATVITTFSGAFTDAYLSIMSRFNFIGRQRNDRTESPSEPGHVRFDDRDNAVYEWHDLSLEDDGVQNERLRRRALLNPTLALMDDDNSSPLDIVNNTGMRMGYNPYESGCLVRTQKDKGPKDLRALSKWIEQNRKRNNVKED